MNRVGIFSGTFDPVHKGHITFALEAIKTADLDKVYFLPESQPRRKEGVTHYAHRVAMLKLALKPFPKLGLLELPDKQFSVSHTLPRIKKYLKDAEVFMLVGSDALEFIGTEKWPNSQLLLDNTTLIVGIRSGQTFDDIQKKLKILSHNGFVVQTDKPYASSRDIRHQLIQGKSHAELLSVLEPYIKENWLYVTV